MFKIFEYRVFESVIMSKIFEPKFIEHKLFSLFVPKMFKNMIMSKIFEPEFLKAQDLQFLFVLKLFMNVFYGWVLSKFEIMFKITRSKVFENMIMSMIFEPEFFKSKLFGLFVFRVVFCQVATKWPPVFNRQEERQEEQPVFLSQDLQVQV